MKPQFLPKYGIGDRVNLNYDGRILKVEEIVYDKSGEWRYRGPIYRNNVWMVNANVSERVLGELEDKPKFGSC